MQRTVKGKPLMPGFADKQRVNRHHSAIMVTYQQRLFARQKLCTTYLGAKVGPCDRLDQAMNFARKLGVVDGSSP